MRTTATGPWTASTGARWRGSSSTRSRWQTVPNHHLPERADTGATATTIKWDTSSVNHGYQVSYFVDCRRDDFFSLFRNTRVSPLRFQRGGSPELNATIEKSIAAARRFDAAKVRADQLAIAASALAD